MEYFFTADLDAQYYSPRDYANDAAVGFGAGWTEKISTVTNKASYTALDGVPSGGTDYFTRIREGESNIEWVQLVGTLTVTNKVAGSNDVFRLHTPDGTIPRMTLVGDHSWRYHYEVPTNAIGGKLSFKLVAKEHYTNATDAATWLTRTNELFTVEETVTEIPYTATLATSNPNEVSVILDESSTHLKIEYNDEQRAFSLSHASYQAFNLWTDATAGFRGNMIDGNGVSNSGVSSRKRRYDAPFDRSWTICPEENTYWSEDLDPENADDANYPLNKWFSVHKTYHGWTMHNGRFVVGARGGASNNLSAALDGLGEGALAMENFSVRQLPLGIDTVSFTARIAQPIRYEDFATYMDGLSSQNYAISAKVTMSRQRENVTDWVFPNDMSPVHPSVSFVGYHRGKKGCYEFRMTRKTDTALELGLYKWVRSGSTTTNVPLKTAVYETNLLVPTSADDVTHGRRTAAYFLLYTFPGTNKVKLEGHIASSRTQPGNGVTGTESGLSTSAIAYVDEDATLARGGTYGIGSTDCRAGFGEIKTHAIQTAPQETEATSGDGRIDEGTFVGRSCLEDEWDCYSSRWEVDPLTYDAKGGMSGVVPSNQVIEVWVSDASSAGSGWENTGYARVVNSFTTNMFTVSPCIPGSWKVRLQTGEDEDAGVVLDDVSVTPWGGTEIWGRDGTVYDFNDDWVYTKGWITAAAESRVCTLQPSRGTDGEPMGIRSPYIDEGMSLFSYSYKDADTNCVMLVQVATNMTPGMGTSYVPGLTESLATSGEYGWTTVARHTFTNQSDLASGTRTAFISKRQHWVYDFMSAKNVYTNVCGVIRVIVDPDVVSRAVNTADAAAHEKMIDYGKITITKAYCYNEPALNLRSWFGFNVFTSGWDDNVAGKYAYLTDWPAGLSIALNFSATAGENASSDADGIGLAESDPSEVQQYTQQNPFVQSATLTNANGIGTVSFRARLFNATNAPGVVTLYGGVNPSSDQPTTESREWDALTNFVVTAPTYQSFEWTFPGSKNKYKAIRLEAAGARWGRYPSGQAAPWEWDDLTDRSKFGSSVVQQPINRVFIDEVSVSELIVPRLKFLDVRPFRDKLGSEEICVITNITKVEQQPLYLESWGIQCRLEPQQMADELDTESIRVWMEAYRGEEPWGYEQWRDLPVSKETMINGQRRVVQQRFTSELMKVPGSDLVFRSYYLFPGSIMPPEEEPGMVYQYMVYATFRDKSGRETVHTNVLEDVDWSPPAWYRGSKVGAANDSGDPAQFSAFTILDSISPQRAWLNELNLCDAMDTKGLYQFIELAVPQKADLRNWSIRFTDYNRKSATLAKIGVDAGVRNITSKEGGEYGVDNTNDYTFVSICAPSATAALKAKTDGSWKVMTTNNLNKGVFQFNYPYGIQLVRPSGIIEHEVVMQGTNSYSGVWGLGFTGTNLVAELKKEDPASTWFYAGEDRPADASLGVFRSHGEEADPSTWSNEMELTPGAINRFKNGDLQDIPYGYFIVPRGGNVWIYSTLLKPQLTKQTLGGRELGANAVIVVPTGTTTNITVTVTNWYQLGVCTIDGDEIPDVRGGKGTCSIHLDSVTNTTRVFIDAERDDVLVDSWGLTDANAYSPAVLDWLLNEYSGYGLDDLSLAAYHDLSGSMSTPLTLTEMYWLNIPPVHTSPVYGGSNVWFVAGMGSLVANSGPPAVEPSVQTLPDGSVRSNVFMTVTMMITNTSTHAAWPPDRLNGLAYDGQGSAGWGSQPAWTSAVFSIVGALQKPDVSTNYYPLQQYTFTSGSFGGADDPQHPFQTRVMVTDPFAPNSMGAYYGWERYRNVYPVWFRWVIKPRPGENRVTTVPLVPNWTPSTSP